MDNKRVGMIGSGLMGTALAERLLDAGYSVWVYNRTREKADPLLARGAHWADNPLAVCGRVMISLNTTDTVEEVLERLAEGLRPGQILIDTTTGGPEQTARLGARLFTDYGLDRGQTYAYRVRAFNAAGESGWSNEVTEPPPARSSIRVLPAQSRPTRKPVSYQEDRTFASVKTDRFLDLNRTSSQAIPVRAGAKP